MIEFRASSVGNCSRQLLATHLDPSLRQVEEARRPFLDAGHYLQQHVEDFIEQQLPSHLDVEKRESEGFIVNPNWTSRGHVDGIFFDGSLLEVKAIKDASFQKLRRASHWLEVYGHYAPQALMYQWMFNAPGTHFVFYNRNTSEMMGSLPIEHGAWEQRPDMYYAFRPDAYNEIVLKLDRVAEYIGTGEEFDSCDNEGYCFFCGTTGTRMRPPTKRSVGLMDDDAEYGILNNLLESLEHGKVGVVEYFTEFKADEIVLHHPNGEKEVLKKEDFV